MLRKESERQQSFYCVLYDKIPEDHILKKVSNVVDFSFINELLEGSYCKNFGRPAKEPEMMMKLKWFNKDAFHTKGIVVSDPYEELIFSIMVRGRWLVSSSMKEII